MTCRAQAFMCGDLVAGFQAFVDNYKTCGPDHHLLACATPVTCKGL